MFKTQELDMSEREINTEDVKTDDSEKVSIEFVKKQKTNAIVKGSKLIGDVEGNITSEQKSNIVIKGNCKGNIKTREGNVDIEGRMTNGGIVAGGNIRITGKFNSSLPGK